MCGLRTLYIDMLKYDGKLVRLGNKLYLQRKEYNHLWSLKFSGLREDELCIKYGIFEEYNGTPQ